MHTCTAFCTDRYTCTKNMLTIFDIGNMHADHHEHRQHACNHLNLCLQTVKDTRSSCQMQFDAWHDALPLLKLGSGIWRPDMADITAIQHTGESAMRDNGSVWMPEHVWLSHCQSVSYPILSQQFAGGLCRCKVGNAMHNGRMQVLKWVYIHDFAWTAQSNITCIS